MYTHPITSKEVVCEYTLVRLVDMKFLPVQSTPAPLVHFESTSMVLDPKGRLPSNHLGAEAGSQSGYCGHETGVSTLLAALEHDFV